MTIIFDTLRLLALALLGVQPMAAERGLATRFGDPGDSLAGNHLYCTGKKMEPGALACAHRTLPCGTVLMLENPRTGRFALCEVLDRGPFGAVLDSGEWGFKIRRTDPGEWRGIVDLSPAVSDALAHNGRERVRVYYKAPRRSAHATTRTEFRRMFAER
jgi:hypothetical protein